MKIILGSQSAGRKKMLEEMGIEFEVMTANIDEKAIRNNDPKELVLDLAKAKAEALKSKIHEPAILITSDQVVVCNDEILEKPENKEDVKRYLKNYERYPAETFTSVVVTNLETGKQESGVDIATTYFVPFSDQEINELVKYDKVYTWAGGYDVDDEKFISHIKSIEGTRDSTMGLPKDLTKILINKVTGK